MQLVLDAQFLTLQHLYDQAVGQWSFGFIFDGLIEFYVTRFQYGDVFVIAHWHSPETVVLLHRKRMHCRRRIVNIWLTKINFR